MQLCMPVNAKKLNLLRRQVSELSWVELLHIASHRGGKAHYTNIVGDYSSGDIDVSGLQKLEQSLLDDT